jgi:hypothetical protein
LTRHCRPGRSPLVSPTANADSPLLKLYARGVGANALSVDDRKPRERDVDGPADSPKVRSSPGTHSTRRRHHGWASRPKPILHPLRQQAVAGVAIRDEHVVTHPYPRTPTRGSQNRRSPGSHDTTPGHTQSHDGHRSATRSHTKAHQRILTLTAPWCETYWDWESFTDDVNCHSARHARADGGALTRYRSCAPDFDARRTRSIRSLCAMRRPRRTMRKRACR